MSSPENTDVETPASESETEPSASPGKSCLYLWWLLVPLSFVVVANVLIWTFMVPKYEAKGEVRIRPIIPRLVFATEDNGPIPFYESYRNTQVAIMRSPPVLNRVLEQGKVKETVWYKKKQQDDEDRSSSMFSFGTILTLEEVLRNDLSVSPRGQTEIIDVSMSALNNKDAAVIVNAVLDEYIKFTREQSDATSDQLYRALMNAFTMLHMEIADREKVVAQVSKELGTANAEQLVSQMRLRLDESETKLKTLRQELVTASWQEKQLAALLPHEEADTKLETLQQELATLGWQKKQLTTLLPQQARPSPNPDKSATAATGVRTEADVIKNMDTVRQQIELLKYQEYLLVEDVKTQRTVFEQIFESAQMLEKENEAIRHKRGLYEAVRTRVDQKEMERNVPGPIEVLTKASAPSEPVNDHRFLATLLTLVLATLAGGFIVWRGCRRTFSAS
jgi:uncharacterized protein involved in exopolysaccharide biosynthesis